MDEKLEIIKPYGYLYANGETYFLMRPEPVEGDSWERDNTYRFLVVPDMVEAYEQKGENSYPIYGYRRHIVTNCFTIEFRDDLPDIYIPALKENMEA